MAAVFSTLGAITGTSLGTAVAGGSNVKGSYVEFSASIGIAAKLIYAYFWPSGTGTTHAYLIDIATGAAASEVVRIPDLYLDVGGAEAKVMQFILRVDPTVFAVGTRIAVRAEGPSATGTEEVNGVLILCDTDLPTVTTPVITSYGVTAGANDKAVIYDPGGTAHTKGGVSQIVASAASDVQLLSIIVGRNRNNTITNASGLMDITGAADAVIIANAPIGANATSDQFYPETLGPFPGDNWQSAKIGVNGQLTIIDATDRLWTVAAVATRGTASGASGGGMRLAGHGGLAA